VILLLPNIIKLFILGMVLLGAGYILYNRRVLKGE